MNTVADSLFSALMSWVRALVNAIWAIFTSERTTILEFLGKNWLLIVAALIAFGLVVDWLIWLLRWQPYHLWAQRVRRLLRIADPQDEDDDEPRAHAATLPQRQTAAPRQTPEQESWLPLAEPVIGEEDARQAMLQAESVPDASLGVYPGMRYDGERTEQLPPRDAQDTQRFAAVHSEGPGAAEVARRRAEIDAWQQQLQEEARAKAEAEQARLLRQAQEAEAARRAAQAEQARRAREAEEERMRAAWAAAEAERARQAQAAAEAERARQAQAAEAERARQAQAQYQRELAQYEQQKAQYERELAEYERQKAAYDAEMARLAEQEAQRQRLAAQPAQAEQGDAKGARRDGGLKGRVTKMALMLEPEETEVSGIRSLPPRVDPREAYGPATRPQKKTGRRRK